MNKEENNMAVNLNLTANEVHQKTHEALKERKEHEDNRRIRRCVEQIQFKVNFIKTSDLPPNQDRFSDNFQCECNLETTKELMFFKKRGFKVEKYREGTYPFSGNTRISWDLAKEKTMHTEEKESR